MEIQGTKNSLTIQNSIEEEQIRRTDSTKIQDLLQSYSNQDRVLLLEK